MAVSHKAMTEGVEEAVNYWLYDHPVSSLECFTKAAEDAVSKWLDDHADVIIERIAQRIADKHSKNG